MISMLVIPASFTPSLNVINNALETRLGVCSLWSLTRSSDLWDSLGVWNPTRESGKCFVCSLRASVTQEVPWKAENGRRVPVDYNLQIWVKKNCSAHQTSENPCCPQRPPERPEAQLRPLSAVLCSGLAPASEPLSPMVYGRPASPIVCKVSPGLMPIYSNASRTFVLLFRVHSFQMPCGTPVGYWA